MLLAQSRHWRVSAAKGTAQVELAIQREGLPEELRELRELRIAVPVETWNRVVKQVLADRKLLGGVLLDFATPADQLSAAVGNDRLFSELQRVVVDATVALIESGTLALAVVDVGMD